MADGRLTEWRLRIVLPNRQSPIDNSPVPKQQSVNRQSPINNPSIGHRPSAIGHRQ
jgi:hypothetical protein